MPPRRKRCWRTTQRWPGVIPVMVVTSFLETYPQSFGLEPLERLRDGVPGVAAVKDDLCGPFVRKACIALAPSMAMISGGQKQNHLDAWLYGCEGYLKTYGRSTQNPCGDTFDPSNCAT